MSDKLHKRWDTIREQRTKRNKEIVRLYTEKEWTMQEVGDKFNLSREMVRIILVQNGVTIRHVGGLSPRKRRAIKQKNYDLAHKAHQWRVENNKTIAQTAKHFRVHPAKLGGLFHKYNLYVRNPTDWNTHGTPSMYNRGCHCDRCRKANTDRMKAYLKSKPKYPSRPWTEEETKYLLNVYHIIGPEKLSPKLKRSASAIKQHYYINREIMTKKRGNGSSSNNSETHGAREESSNKSLPQEPRSIGVEDRGSKISSLLSKVWKKS